VLLDNPLKVFWSAGMVPHAVRIDHGNGALSANPKAICFASMDQRLWTTELELVESGFEKLP